MDERKGSKDLKLHLGCGSVYIPRFVHVDLTPLPHIDHVGSVTDLNWCDNESAELVYASHVLEYFDEREAIDVLQEWHRVLQPGGILRLAVPDLDVLIDIYETTGATATILGPLYGRMESGGEIVYHKTVYNFAALTTLLRATGFKGIRHWDWRKTEHAEVDDCSQAYWPHMDKENGILISLNVEADKTE